MMTNKKISLITCGIIVLMFSSILASGQIKETFESVVKNAISNGVIKKDGYKITYIAAPGQDTVKIRTYYQDLIKQTGKPYQFSFASNATVIQTRVKNTTNSNTITQPKPQNNDSPYRIAEGNNNGNQIMVPPTTAGTPGNPVAPGGCWTRQNVFGELHYTDKSEEYTFDVPSDVTSIKIEAWSGGGHGYAETDTLNTSTWRIKELILIGVYGGGGGGGAYACTVIPVKKGDRVTMIIPPGGGGKTLEVVLNGKDNKFFLNNGSDGKRFGTLFGNGAGGNSGGVYGVFKGKLFWMGGEDGDQARTSEYSFRQGNNGDGMLVEPTQSLHTYIVNFGKGGNAALLNNGGRPAILSKGRSYPTMGENGRYPGGGGGGGDKFIFYRITGPGKGAPGMVIIHY